MKRAVITGIGIWSCIGTDCNEVAQSLKAGRCGIGIDPARTDYGYRSPLTGIVPRPALKGLLDRPFQVENLLPAVGAFAAGWLIGWLF